MYCKKKLCLLELYNSIIAQQQGALFSSTRVADKEIDPRETISACK